MATYIIAFLVIEGLLAAVIILASKHGSKAEKLEALKKELRKQAEEQERVNEIHSNVSNLNKSDVYSLLQKTSNKQR